MARRLVGGMDGLTDGWIEGCVGVDGSTDEIMDGWVIWSDDWLVGGLDGFVAGSIMNV